MILDTIRDRMAELGLTSYAVAKATAGRVSEDTVRRIVTGTGNPSAEAIDAIFDVLGLEIRAKKIPKKSAA